MTYTYIPKGICSRKIEIDLVGDIIEDVRMLGGCDGNHKGIIRLVQGQRAGDVARLLRGVRCEERPTSCPDQLALALDAALEQQERGGTTDE